MGNEQSQISGVKMDQKAIEVSDFWTQHNATINNVQNESKISIFAGDLFLNDPFWNPQTPLEKCSKNIMIYRHPCIVKYISSWQKACKFYLAIEEVTPLSHMIAHMDTMEISLGLYSILKALCFLHEKASVSHNNVCLSSIFVTKEGSWKLGGMEYLCPYKELSSELLKKSRCHRYSKAVDTNEEKNLKHSSERKDFIDVFAFCTLVIELLKNKNDDEISKLSSFKEFCKNIVQEPNVLQRPTLSSLLEHEFFKHKFINIHSFLIELPLKSDVDKTEFFAHLKEELQLLNEEIVASQLGRLLVSRMVLLNNGARNYLLPYILIPRKGENGAIFSEQVFKKYIAPKLLNIFCVRDAQIRLLLLEYFSHFIDYFSKEELEMHILPELLVGIKDTNNELVASTLHTLAELVPVLGAEIVIGGRRAKLFNDGRPKTQSSSRKIQAQELPKPEVLASSLDELSANNSLLELIHNRNELPERPRPDGEEGETSTDEIEQSADEDIENWEEWDNENNVINEIEENKCFELETLSAEIDLIPKMPVNSKPKQIIDITELDIKNPTKIKIEQSDNDIDFFEDMVPVIQTSNKFVIDSTVSSKFCADNGDVNEDGWGDDWES
ncbi:unnamed protein product [Ceutorhynchus assimilis]|uniref:Protein kinase domain-containing protein n=1 Tax=Ceutorhynchus assimilis TaxID=467358 RepID=A0A9N9QQ61_9CUCU|nr:unnamed protein product [Ceutorhynchus assimilis]